ncbi:MAG: UDP-3-O-acylglucosamine N-acyltransferase [Candidatus Omnitrophica bacterium ADurb.Bin314]|nr:MAG: UDP-3-O-acylglucosamine N-acyltransferase [Candidatus Omnitrophica bacterium ADurb.Bin314]HOE68426.1 UDP-3-O-(3-hydroxymyristoyl)glucosamine N-acyltransferase [Candidatus Omnitrophota bacterium]
MKKSVQEIARIVGGTVVGDASFIPEGITNIENPLPGHITFAQDEKGFRALETSGIACLIVPKQITQSSKVLIQVEHPKRAWAKLLREIYPPRKFVPGISPEASVAASAKIGANVTVEAFAVIGENSTVSEGTVIRSGAFIDENVKIGANCVIHPNVTIYRDSDLGANVIIHAGTAIGADGFGYVATPTGQEKLPQVGNVVIEDDVEIGACCTVDRAALGSTRIGKGVKIDNLVQIAHNVVIGPHTVISAQTGISGSCKIGSHVTMGGSVGVGDHVEIGDWAMVGAGAGFPSNKKVPGKQIYFGQPARPYAEMRKQFGAQLRSAETLDDVRALKKKVAELEKKLAS